MRLSKSPVRLREMHFVQSVRASRIQYNLCSNLRYEFLLRLDFPRSVQEKQWNIECQPLEECRGCSPGGQVDSTPTCPDLQRVHLPQKQWEPIP